MPPQFNFGSNPISHPQNYLFELLYGLQEELYLTVLIFSVTLSYGKDSIERRQKEMTMTAILSTSPVRTALQWDLGRPKQFLVVRKDMDPDYVEKLELEYKRYLALLAAYPREKFPISNAVDELWHAHLLFTDDYHLMSNEICGGYVHHLPTLSEDERVALEPEYFDGTLRRYRELFGLPPEYFWPSDSGSICWSCSRPPGITAQPM